MTLHAPLKTLCTGAAGGTRRPHRAFPRARSLNVPSLLPGQKRSDVVTT